MALYTIFVCDTCGHQATNLSDPPVWSCADACPVAECNGTMSDTAGVCGTY